MKGKDKKLRNLSLSRKEQLMESLGFQVKKKQIARQKKK